MSLSFRKQLEFVSDNEMRSAFMFSAKWAKNFVAGIRKIFSQAVSPSQKKGVRLHIVIPSDRQKPLTCRDAMLFARNGLTRLASAAIRM